MWDRFKYYGWVIGLLLLVSFGINRGVLHTSYQADIGGHLISASKAATPDVAILELDSALNGLDKRNLGTGSTAIINPSEMEDIAVWRSRLILASKEYSKLLKVEKTPVSLENPNLELKAAMDRISNSLYEPEGISIYPFNSVFFVLGILGVLLLFLSFFMSLWDEIHY